MSSREWCIRTIEDVSEEVFSGGTPSTSNKAYWDGEFNWLSSGETRSEFIFDTEKKITRKAIEESTTKLAKKGSIVIASAGQGKTRGQVSFLCIDTYINQSIIAISPKSEIIDPLWIYYNLSNRYEELRQLSDSASIRGSLTTKVIKQLKISFPESLSSQKRIVDILKSLDEKIELNRQTNATLEAVAQAIFKEWFVDNREVESWKLVPLPEIIEINPQRAVSKNQRTLYISMSNVPTVGHRAIEWTERPFNGSGTKFINGDTLMAKITPCLENGKTAFVDFLEDGQVGWGSTEFIVFRPYPPLPPEFGYFLARSEELRNHAIQNMVGTSGRQRTPVSCFNHFMVRVPPKDLSEEFGEISRAIMSTIKAKDEESRTLTQIRDTLLPRLMNGDLEL